MREQNGKLREALLRLRDTSTLEKANLEKEMLVYKKQFENMNDSNNKMNELIKENGTYKNQIGILKDQVDDARAFETLVEDLTEKNLDYYEKNAELIGTGKECLVFLIFFFFLVFLILTFFFFFLFFFFFVPFLFYNKQKKQSLN